MKFLRGRSSRQPGGIVKRGVVPEGEKGTRQYVCGEPGCRFKTVKDFAPYGNAESQAAQHLSATLNSGSIEGGCIPTLGITADRRSHRLQRIER